MRMSNNINAPAGSLESTSRAARVENVLWMMDICHEVALLDVMNLEEPHFPFWKKSFLPGALPDILTGNQTIFVFDLTRF